MVALPEERRAILACATDIQKERVNGYTLYNACFANKAITVVEAGMGIAAATSAASSLIDAQKPRLLISAGFCGAVRAGCNIGDIVLCKQLWQQDVTELSRCTLPDGMADIESVQISLKKLGLPVKIGNFITTTTIASKAYLGRQLPVDMSNPVLEMESAAVANVALKNGLLFLGIRTVSDDATEELLFSIDEISKNNRISIPKLMLVCLQKPAVIPQLAKLAKNSSIAGKNLTAACAAVFNTFTEP